MAVARKKIPQDVLDFIALSGVDPEVAIGEYLRQGTMGKTGEWEHDEVVRQIGRLEGGEGAEVGEKSAKKEEKTEIAKAKEPVKAEDKSTTAAKPVEQAAKDAPVVEEPKSVSPKPVASEPMPTSATTAPKEVEPVATEKKAGAASPVPSKTTGMSFLVTSQADKPTTVEKLGEDVEDFNAAALPRFGS